MRRLSRPWPSRATGSKSRSGSVAAFGVPVTASVLRQRHVVPGGRALAPEERSPVVVEILKDGGNLEGDDGGCRGGEMRRRMSSDHPRGAGEGIEPPSQVDVQLGPSTSVEDAVAYVFGRRNQDRINLQRGLSRDHSQVSGRLLVGSYPTSTPVDEV